MPASRWRIISGRLPGRFTLDPHTGTITGTPVYRTTAHFRVRVTDAGHPPRPRLGRSRSRWPQPAGTAIAVSRTRRAPSARRTSGEAASRARPKAAFNGRVCVDGACGSRAG
ncbi:MAG: cadherin repeat domain-containing protein [Solirubrobacteraceae bacterium]